MQKLAFTLVTLGLITGNGSLHAQSKGWVNPAPNAPRGFLDEINFETDTAILIDGQKPSLVAVANAAVKDNTIYLVVEGWTDGRGDPDHNFRLSEARAKAVAEYLAAIGVPADRVRYVGQGKAGRPSSPVVNFANRKCVLILRRGGFDGEPITNMRFALVDGGLPAYGRITQNGNTFIVRLDYGKIRQDFHTEVDRIADAAVNQNEEFSRAAVAKIDRKIDELIQVAREREISNVHPLYRVSVGVTPSRYEDDSMGTTFDAAMLSCYTVGATQVGIQGDASNLRRKFQIDAAYTIRSGVFQPSVFLGYGSVQNTAYRDQFVNRSGVFMAGARLAYEGEFNGVGATYASVNSHETSDTTILQPSEPWGYAGLDYHYDRNALGLYLSAGSLVGQPRIPPPATNPDLYKLTSKVNYSAEVSYRFQEAIYGARGFIRLEQAPVYQVLPGSKSELRAIIGVRLLGASTADQARWVRVPSFRKFFPF